MTTIALINNFLKYQMPALIHALEGIANHKLYSISSITTKPSDDILRDFYCGNYQPGEEAAATKTPNYQILSQKIMELEDPLREKLGPENWQMVEEYCDALVARNEESCIVAFEIGFQTATQLLIAGLALNETQEYKNE